MSLIETELVRIERLANGLYVDGHYIDGVSSYYMYYVNVQPTSGEELMLLPEANRPSESITIYSSNVLETDDIVRREIENIAQVNTCTIDSVEDETIYTVTIGYVAHSFTSGIGATALEITTGLVAVINLDSLIVTAEDNLDGTYTITSNYKGDSFAISVDDNQSQVSDVASALKEFKIIKCDNWMSHSLSHCKAFGYLIEE